MQRPKGNATTRLKVAALTSGRNIPSARFRVRQYRPFLAEHGIELTEHCPAIPQQIRLPGWLGRIRRRYLPPWIVIQMLINAIGRVPAFLGARSAHVCLINRTVMPGLDETVHLLPRPRILDVDDAVWLSDPRGWRAAARIARNVDAIIVGNTYLEEWYKHHNDQVFVLPTAVNTQEYSPLPRGNTARGTVTIGWIGTSGNFGELELVRGVVRELVQCRPHVRCVIVSNSKPPRWLFDGQRIIFRRWSARTEIDNFRELDIGLMPLTDNDWTKGKCSFKMLQYLACGCPVVVSPVGMNAEILRQGHIGYGATSEVEWFAALDELSSQAELLAKLGENGRALAERLYSTDSIARRLAEILRSVSNGAPEGK